MSPRAKILVVDDEPGIRDLLSYELASREYLVSTARDGEEAVEKVRQEKFQLIISDVKMPRLGGLEMLGQIKKLDAEVEVIMSTGHGTVETAVEAMKTGAYDFIQKPFNIDEMLALVEKALEKRDLKALVGIYEASKAVFSSIQLETLLPVMTEIAMRVLKADDASIMLMRPDGALELATSMGLEGDGRRKSRLLLGERVAGRVAQTRESLLINGPLERDARFAGVGSLRDIRSSIVFPLLVGGKILGVLSANRTKRGEPFSAAEVQYATILSSHISQALYNAKLYRDLEEKIEEIKTMQAQLVQTEKLAAVGQLATGVAHEINNPLTGILGFAELMLEDGRLRPEQREDLESIKHQSQRCRKIVQNLLQFSRKKAVELGPLKLEDVLAPIYDLVRADLRAARIELKKEVPAALPAIWGDAPGLEQVLLNLFSNAKHALKGKKGGRLTISAQASGEWVVLKVSDNGCGIPPDIIGRVFDPFFTTKPVGEGTGLGLSITYGIVEQHNGRIRVESELGVGTTFIVELPTRAPAGHENTAKNPAG